MKFIYVDESGAADHGDVFVMCGLMVDAYKLRKKTQDFDQVIGDIVDRHPGVGTELKTSRFINGRGAWRDVDAGERKELLTNLCELAVANGGKLFGVALSFAAFAEAINAGHDHPFGNSYWLAAAFFTSCLVQKKMQGIKNSKGLTVVIMDDNKVQMPALSDGLHQGDPWFDGLYQVARAKRGKRTWNKRDVSDRFDHIVNTAFAIKSNHSSLVQVADALSYVFRRHLELLDNEEAWGGEREYYDGLMEILDPAWESLGRCADAPCVDFYRAAKHPGWEL